MTSLTGLTRSRVGPGAALLRVGQSRRHSQQCEHHDQGYANATHVEGFVQFRLRPAPSENSENREHPSQGNCGTIKIPHQEEDVAALVRAWIDARRGLGGRGWRLHRQAGREVGTGPHRPYRDNGDPGVPRRRRHSRADSADADGLTPRRRDRSYRRMTDDRRTSRSASLDGRSLFPHLTLLFRGAIARLVASSGDRRTSPSNTNVGDPGVRHRRTATRSRRLHKSGVGDGAAS